MNSRFLPLRKKVDHHDGTPKADTWIGISNALKSSGHSLRQYELDQVRRV